MRSVEAASAATIKAPSVGRRHPEAMSADGVARIISPASVEARQRVAVLSSKAESAAAQAKEAETRSKQIN